MNATIVKEDVVGQLNSLRLTAFRTNAQSDKDAYHRALSAAFQNGELVSAATSAAAPDLYEALRALVDELDETFPFEGLPSAKAALAKARGEVSQ